MLLADSLQYTFLLRYLFEKYFFYIKKLVKYILGLYKPVYRLPKILHNCYFQRIFHIIGLYYIVLNNCASRFSMFTRRNLNDFTRDWLYKIKL